jgi:transposase
MARYGRAFRERAVARLLPPESSSVELVSREIGVSVATLERWRAEALSQADGNRIWTAAARLEAVIATAAMDAEAKSAWCREQGLYLSDLEAWRQGAMLALAEPGEAPASPQQTRQAKKRIKELERELKRKDKALAETAALLVLSKKLSAIYGEGADE